jgi:hypothetical protein
MAVSISGQAEREGQGLDVAVPDAAAAGAQDPADERGVLDLPPRPFRCQPALTMSGLVSWATDDELSSG